METGTLPTRAPLFTLKSVTVILWTLVTPVRLTVTCDPLTLKLLMSPVPEVTEALSTVTLVANVMIIWKVGPVRHSTPTLPASGSGTSKVPAPP